ncbi:hypothetical protein RTCIAT899_CH10780 [Rhizobium tropici CIAT 899]|nr:hypothetical protein RTCIAT899_CH10780 [Rhizobium tropici CIAT 899]
MPSNAIPSTAKAVSKSDLSARNCFPFPGSIEGEARRKQPAAGCFSSRIIADPMPPAEESAC